MSKVAATSFSHNTTHPLIQIVAGVAVKGAGRGQREAWGLSRNANAGQAEVAVVVPNSTTGVRGSFYTRAVGGSTYPMDLVTVGAVDLFMSDNVTLSARVGGVVQGTTATLANALFTGFTNQISFSVDLSATVGALTFIVNGTTLTITGLNTISTSVNSFSIFGINGDRAGSALMDICVYDDAGASFNGIPPFTQSRKSGTAGNAGTFTDWLASGTIPSTPKNSITLTGATTPTTAMTYAGYSPIQKKHYWTDANMWMIVDVSNAGAAPVVTYNTTASRPISRSAVYVQMDDRIYFTTNTDLLYFDCATEIASASIDNTFQNMINVAYDASQHKLYFVKNTVTVKVFDIPSQAAGSDITLSFLTDSAEYCPSTKEVFFLGITEMGVVDATTSLEVVGSPYTISAASTNRPIIYNPIADSMIYLSLSGTKFVLMKCDTRSITISALSGSARGEVMFDPNSGASYSRRGEALSGEYLEGGTRYETVSSSTGHPFGAFDPERGSFISLNTARTSLVEYELSDSGTPAINDMVVRNGDTGRIVSAIANDKHSVNVNRDLSADVTTPEMIGVNITVKNITGDNSTLQFGTVDELGNKNTGATVATTGTAQDFQRTEFVNSQGNDFTEANIDALEVSMEAL